MRANHASRAAKCPSAPGRLIAAVLAACLLACTHPGAPAQTAPSDLDLVPADTTGPVFSDTAVDVPVKPINFRKPVFPQDLQQEAVCGWADITYVVGTNGRAEPNSVTVVRATHRAFGTSGAAAIRGSTFTPATRLGKVVRQRVSQRVSFQAGIPGAPGCY